MKKIDSDSFSSTLRIHGDLRGVGDLDRYLGVNATHKHVKGDVRSELAKPYSTDMWSYTCPLKELDFEAQLCHFADKFHVKLVELRRAHDIGLVKIDVFCSFIPQFDNSGFDISPKALQFLCDAKMPLAVSVMFA